MIRWKKVFNLILIRMNWNEFIKKSSLNIDFFFNNNHHQTWNEADDFWLQIWHFKKILFCSVVMEITAIFNGIFFLSLFEQNKLSSLSTKFPNINPVSNIVRLFFFRRKFENFFTFQFFIRLNGFFTEHNKFQALFLMYFSTFSHKTSDQPKKKFRFCWNFSNGKSWDNIEILRIEFV